MLTRIPVLFDLVVAQAATRTYVRRICLFILFQNDIKKNMLKDAFDKIQCLICYETFKEYMEYVFKRHFVYYHFNIGSAM